VRLRKARVLVLALSDPFSARRALAVARDIHPEMHIIVRTRYVSEVEDLLRHGADEVVPEEFETSIEIFGLVLRHYGLDRAVINRKQEEIRREGYAVLRRQPIDERPRYDLPEEMEAERYRIEPGSALAGRTLQQIALRARSNVLVVTLLREDATHVNPSGDMTLEPGDVLVLLGTRDDLERARELLDQPESASD
jgi:CPA2 family monovalent cation:H+ antiporter-2